MIVISCQHDHAHKHGKDRQGNQRYKCGADCGLTFVLETAKPIGDLRIDLKQATLALSLMLEGMSVRAVQRLTGLCRQTLADLILVVGENCQRLLNAELRSIAVDDVQLDELWSFVGCKEKTRVANGYSDAFGDSWTFLAIERNGPPSVAGVYVNETTALGLSAFWCGVRTISVDVASLKIRPFVTESGGGCKPASDHWSYNIVYHTPDGERPAIRFWASIVQHALTWGNGYAFIERNNAGYGIKLHLLPPDRITPRVDRLPFYYEWHGEPYPFLGKNPNKIMPWNIVHIANPMSLDARVGLSVVQVARESIGLGLGADLSMAAWYGNASRPGGMIQTSGNLNPQAMTNKREYYDKLHQGPLNNGRIGLMLPGDTYAANQLPAPDEAYLNSRVFQIQEIARWFPVPPTKLGDYSHSTYANLEQASLDYIQTSVKPWGDFICAELNLKLLWPDERDNYFFRPDYKGLIEADTAAKTAYYASGRQWGYLNVNKILHMEGENGIGPAGEIYLSPANMVTDKQLLMQNDSPPPAAPPPASTPDPQEPIKNALLDVARAELERAIRREQAAVKRAAGKSDFRKWLSDFYGGEHRNYLDTAMASSLKAYRLVGGASRFDAQAWCDRSLSDLLALEEVTTSDQRPAAVDDLFKGWQSRCEDFLTQAA